MSASPLKHGQIKNKVWRPHMLVISGD